MSDYTSNLKFKPDTEIDPVEEAAEYVNHLWVQTMAAIRTRCFHCGADSPIIHVPSKGAIAFGNPRLLRSGPHKIRDLTQDVQLAFAKQGWKFQLRRSYCPSCKGLGRV